MGKATEVAPPLPAANPVSGECTKNIGELWHVRCADHRRLFVRDLCVLLKEEALTDFMLALIWLIVEQRLFR